MLKEIRKNIIESDEGFSVELVGRGGIKYKEGSKPYSVDSEILISPAGYGLIIYKARIKNCESPNGICEPVVDKKKDEIVENIRKAFLFWGYKIEIQEHEL